MTYNYESNALDVFRDTAHIKIATIDSPIITNQGEIMKYEYKPEQKSFVIAEPEFDHETVGEVVNDFDLDELPVLDDIVREAVKSGVWAGIGKIETQDSLNDFAFAEHQYLPNWPDPVPLRQGFDTKPKEHFQAF